MNCRNTPGKEWFMKNGVMDLGSRGLFLLLVFCSIFDTSIFSKFVQSTCEFVNGESEVLGD